MARQQLFSPVQSFIAGRDARLSHDYGQTRNKLAEMELADAPAQMQRRNALADVQLQGAQVGLEGAQQQLGADKAKFAYAKLKQALDSGSARQYVMQQIPELASALQQRGVDLRSMDDESGKGLIENLARKYAGEAGIAPAQPKTPEAFTLGAGQTRYGPDGKPIASAPVSNEMTPYQRERLRIEREKMNRPDKQTGAFRPLTPKEVADAGLPEGTSAQVNERTGQINVLSKAPKPVASEADSAAQKLDAAMNTLSAIRDVKEAIGWNTTGVGGQILGSVAGTDAADMAANIDTIKANVGFDRLQMMRDASKTGGALGGIAVQELNMLQSTIASLNTKQSGPQLKKNVEKVEAQYTKAVNAYRKAMGLPPMEDQGAASGQPPGTPAGEVRVNSPQEAMALPPGTVFITPDGRRKVR